MMPAVFAFLNCYQKIERLFFQQNLPLFRMRQKKVIDTLFAEGQRRYAESLSAYARQFMARMVKPDVDYIKGLCPAIAIEQKVITRTPRSTVGSMTEIYDYLRLLYARAGKTISPISGREVKKDDVHDVVMAVQKMPKHMVRL